MFSGGSPVRCDDHAQEICHFQSLMLWCNVRDLGLEVCPIPCPHLNDHLLKAQFFLLYAAYVLPPPSVLSAILFTLAQGNANMSVKYQPVPLDDEKPCLSAYESSTTLNDLESTLQNDTNGPRPTDIQWHGLKLASNWVWLIHAVLLLASCTLFALAVTIRSSTLKHVQEFSAYCEKQPKGQEYC